MGLVDISMKTQAKKAAKRGRPAKKFLIVEDSPCSLNSLIDQQIEDQFTVIRMCSNTSWVIVRMDGLAVPVKCPSRISQKLLGKRIKVCLVSADPEDYYEYVS
jgi:hypothetical protein